MEPRTLMAAAVGAIGVGSGLIGNYFAGDTLQNLAYTHRDGTVNFNWGTTSPNAAVPADRFSVRWVGKVQPEFSEPYTFHTVSDGGVRLWVNGQLLIDNWSEHTTTIENVGTIELKAGELYDLKLEYRETTGTAVAKLLWSSPSTPAGVVPTTQLYSTGAGWVSGNWLNQDIGIGGRAGSLKSTGAAYTLQGAGAARVGATSDRLQYAYQTLNGDGSITARLTSVQNGSSSGRVGVMIRDSLLSGSAFAGLLFNPATAGPAIADTSPDTDPGAALQYRARRGTRTLSAPGVVPAGAWVRLVRDGNVFRAYTSPTGADDTWAAAGTAVVPMGRTVYVGLSLSSGSSDRLATAGFSNVIVKETVPLGAGIDSLRDWNLGNVFVDIAKQARTFQQPNVKDPPVAVDSTGWPLADFSTILQSGFDQTGHVYAGTYKLSFTGQATLGTWNSPAKITNQSYDPSTNTTTADVTLTPPEDGGWYFGLNFTETRRTADAPTGSGITNLKVIRPGYDPQTTQVFTDEYLKHLEQFSVLRFMGFTNTNNNPVVNWSDRAQVTDARQSTNKGVAWEYVIDLANLTGKDVWINVPGHANDDYVRNLAALFKAKLDPGRVVYLENGNEVWNYQFDQAQYNLQQAKAEVYSGTSNLNNDNTLNTGLWAYRRHARRTKEIGEIFADAFGPGSMNTRVRPVLGAQYSNSDSVRQPLAWLDKTYGPPSNYLYAVASAPYFGADGRDTGADVTAQDVLDGMESSVNKRNQRHPMYHGLAERYGLRSFAYEGGTGLEGAENLDVKTQALFDPQTRQIVADYLNGWYGTGGDLFEWFMAGPTNWTSQFGSWGLTNAVDNFDSPKLQGTIDVANGPKAAPFVGVSVPGEIDARFNTNMSTPLWQAPPVDPYLRYLGAGATFDYLVRAPVNGTYYLRVSAAAVAGDKPLEVWVNDRKAPTVTVPDNGTDNDFDKFVDSNAIPITMRQGVNLVRLVVPSSRPYNIESLKFTTTPDGGVGDTMPIIGGMGFANSQTISSAGSFTGSFNVADAETDLDALTVTATSDNPLLFPNGSLVVSGTGRQRTLSATPSAQAAGVANITLTVTDGAGNSRTVLFTKINVRPVTPGSLRATAVAPDQVQLTWDDRSANETSFKVDYSVSSDFRSVKTVTVAAGSSGYLATGLKSNTRYYFRVRSAAASAGDGTIESGSTTPVNVMLGTFSGAPTTPIRAAASPSTVTGTATTLSVLGDDDGGETALKYTWQVVSAPGGATGAKAPSFSANGTNGAKSTTVTFFAAGNYTFMVAVTDAGGKTTPSHVDVTVVSTLTRLDVLPKTANVQPGGRLHFIPLGKDQFGGDVAAGIVTWSASGGSINSGTGEFLAPSKAATILVTATGGDGTVEGTAQVSVGGAVNPAPTVAEPASADPSPVTDTSTTLSALGDDDGGADKLTYTWATVSKPNGAASPVFDANGSNAASITDVTFARAGLYTFRVTISDGSLAVTSSVTVDVRPTATLVTVVPASTSIPTGAGTRFTAVVRDQFGDPLATQPPLSWSVDGGVGSITNVGNDGIYTAPTFATVARVVAAAPLYGVEGSAQVTVTDDGSVESPLYGEDIGPVGLPGDDRLAADGTWTVSASGNDIFVAPDEGRFVHKKITGDVTLIARVASLTNTDAWSKAGVMIRESTATDAKFAYSVITPGNGASFGRRTAVGSSGGSSNIAGPTAPEWVKLTRSGNSFVGYFSPDGQNWTQIGSRTINMAATVEAGLVVTAHDDSRLATATFDNVSVVPAPDLALGKPVVGSSAATGLEVQNVVDGNGGSRWESVPGVAPGAEQWVRVDLGQSSTIGRVRLNWASAFATGYRIQASNDDKTWSDLYSTSSGDGNTDDILSLSATGRYVRVFMDTPNVDGGPVALNDFNVYGA